jgi:hypothetical protein
MSEKHASKKTREALFEAYKKGRAEMDEKQRQVNSDRTKQDEFSQDDSLANIQVVDHQGERVPVRAVWTDEDLERS